MSASSPPNAQLPSTWQIVSLKDVCEFILDGTHGSPERIKGGIPLLSAKNVYSSELHFDAYDTVTSDEYKYFRRRLPIAKGDVLLTIVGSIGRAAVVETDRPFMLLRSVCVLRPRWAVLESEYLMRVLQGPEVQFSLSEKTKQGSQPGIYLTEINALNIPLPPLAEQQRIAARLNAQMAAVEQARAAALAQVEAAGALTIAHLREAFDGDKAEEWPQRRLGEIAKTTSGSTPPRGNGNYFGGTLPWVKTGELKDGEIEDTEERVTDAAIAECHLPILPPGTLLIAMYGQGQTRGRTGLLRVPATTNQACFAVLPNQEVFDPGFLQLWFRRNYKALRDRSEGRGGNQPNLNGIVLNSLLIPVPPLDEQRSIVKRLNELGHATEQLYAVAQSQLASIEAMPAALLRAAFSGKL